MQLKKIPYALEPPASARRWQPATCISTAAPFPTPMRRRDASGGGSRCDARGFADGRGAPSRFHGARRTCRRVRRQHQHRQVRTARASDDARRYRRFDKPVCANSSSASADAERHRHAPQCRAACRRRASAPASSSAPTATSSPTRTSSTARPKSPSS